MTRGSFVLSFTTDKRTPPTHTHLSIHTQHTTGSAGATTVDVTMADIAASVGIYLGASILYVCMCVCVCVNVYMLDVTMQTLPCPWASTSVRRLLCPSPSGDEHPT